MSSKSLLLSLLVVTLLFVGSTFGASGWASCFGNYRSVLSPNSVVSSGIGSFIAGEDWTYTTAICSNWANSMAGACAQVSCVQGGAGASGGMNCVSNPKATYVRVIDTLGNDCSGSPVHVFDLNDVPFNQLGWDGASCSGKFAINYSPVSCQTAGLVSGGIKIGIAPNGCDPWCPSFVFSNVGGSGALLSVSVSSDGGGTWNSFKRNSGNGARWDCNGGSGTYLNKVLSFKFTGCSVGSSFSSCAAGDTITAINVLPSSWCGNSGTPCASRSFQASNNLGSGGSSQPTTQPTTPTAQPTTPTAQPTASASNQKIRCGKDWTAANTKCGSKCTDNSQCAAGETCFADLDTTPCGATQPTPVAPTPVAPTPVAPTPVAPTPVAVKPTNSPVRCGKDWTSANNDCYGKKCANNGDCAAGTTCFADLKVCAGAANLEDETTQPNLINSSLTPAQIAGIAVASVVLVVIVVAAFFLLRKRPVEEIV